MAARNSKDGNSKSKLPPLRVVVMSATLDVETFLEFFGSPATIKIPGRQFPVRILYTKESQEVGT